jgi:hypothetical protein
MADIECGKAAHAVLPPNWSGFCVLGSIRSSFFMLPLPRGELLGVPVCESWEAQRKWHALPIGNWKDDEWPPECLIHFYGQPLGQRMGFGDTVLPLLGSACLFP